jgi:hypothetical protein
MISQITYSMKEQQKNQENNEPKMRSRLAVIISDLRCIYSLDNEGNENFFTRWIKVLFHKIFKIMGA